MSGAAALLDALHTRDWVRLAYIVGNNVYHAEDITDLIKEMLTDGD